MAASITQLMEDPEFLAFPPEAQQRIVSQLFPQAPAGAALSPEDRVASTLALSKIKEPTAGNLQPETLDQSLTGAISRGLLSGATLGTSEAIAKRFGGVPQEDPLGPEAQHPYVSLGSSVVGGIPTGIGLGKLAGAGGKLIGLSKGATTAGGLAGVESSTLANFIKNALLKAGPAGAAYAGVSGSMNELGKPGSTLEEIAQAGLAETPKGYALGVTIPVVIGAFKVAGKALISGGRTAQQLFSGAANTSIEGADNHLPEILYYAGERNPNISPTEQLIQGAWAAVKERTDIARNALSGASPSIKNRYFGNYNADARAFIEKEVEKLHTLSPQQKNAMISKIQATIDNTTPDEIINTNRLLNAETRSLQDPLASHDNLTKYELNIKKDLAEYNSDIIKKVLTASGVDPDVYSESGKIANMASSLQKTLRDARQADEILAGTSATEAAANKAAEKGPGAGIATGLKRMAINVTGGEEGAMDAKTLRIFEKVDPLASQLRQSLPYFPPSGQAAGIPPATLSMAPVELATPALPAPIVPSIDDQLQLIIDNLPSNAKGFSPSIQRQIAISILEGNSNPATPRALTGQTINRPVTQ